jgi:putative membrane protein
MRPSVYKRFGALTTEDAEAKRLVAFNQGFYNLFLAAGVLAGLALLHSGGNVVVAQTLVLFCCACMFGAGVVLMFSGGRRMLRAAVIQALFPLLAWSAWLWL